MITPFAIALRLAAATMRSANPDTVGTRARDTPNPECRDDDGEDELVVRRRLQAGAADAQAVDDAAGGTEPGRVPGDWVTPLAQRNGRLRLRGDGDERYVESDHVVRVEGWR